MRRFLNIVLVRRFRLAMLTGYVAFGDKLVQLATIAPVWRRNLWESWRRPRLVARVQLLEARIG